MATALEEEKDQYHGNDECRGSGSPESVEFWCDELEALEESIPTLSQPIWLKPFGPPGQGFTAQIDAKLKWFGCANHSYHRAEPGCDFCRAAGIHLLIEWALLFHEPEL